MGNKIINKASGFYASREGEGAEIGMGHVRGLHLGDVLAPGAPGFQVDAVGVLWSCGA